MFNKISLLLLFSAKLMGVFGQSTTLPPGFAETAVAEGLNPTSMALAPDGRIFLAQKDGRVLLFHTENAELHEEPFLQLDTDDFNERGLNGIALHPDFENQPWVYLYYTLPNEPRNRISRVLANGDFAVPGSEQVLLDLDLLNGNVHNAGALVFGTDGNLYIGVGDGAKSNNGQDMGTLLGKTLRLNADGSIPADNPFYDQLAGNLRAIYAYGVRNPFSMAADAAGGKIYFCDVGAEAWEEVNQLLPGANYGWKLYQGPSGSPGLTDPVFAYQHDAGCAIVGAAFAFAGHPLAPDNFKGKFFFADYCFGWIRVLDPAIGLVTDSLATGIDRPVSLLTGPDGDLYYLARAGLGGGSPLDNTASTEGLLWRVFWIGEGAPQLTGQPQAVLVAEGETAIFRATAFGSRPIAYQWYRDGLDIPGADSTVLALSDLALADSGAVLFCMASNAFGTDTSQSAVLGVSSNKRPLPKILLPGDNQTYQGGDTLFFTGQAVDPEEGVLPASQLSWRIDFHHADHSHPALPPTSGNAEGSFVVPTVGETATDVFYRICLSATDQAGFSNSIYRDVFPEKTSISVAGPPGIALNVDGQIRPLPADFESVVGLLRTLEAPEQQQIGDTVYVFRKWADGYPSNLISFFAPDSLVDLEVLYDMYFPGKGKGLLGHYFFDPEGDFDSNPVLTRVDTTINFTWNDKAPDSLLPQDYFTVRWMGFVQPQYGETYTFSVRSDDGCRLWVNDQMIIDQWVPQAITEHAGAIALEAGKKYRIRLEYLEIGGGASVQLFWSSAHQDREIVPKRQLYLPNFSSPATLSGVTGLDTDNNGIWEPGEATFTGATVALYEADTDSLIAQTKTVSGGRYTFVDLPAGNFYLKISLPPSGDILLPVQNVDANGQTPTFLLDEGAFERLDAAWTVSQLALGGLVWLDENRDGLQGSTEPVLPGLTVLLYRSDSTLVAAGMTSAEGRYGFSLLSPGAYFMVFLHQFYNQFLLPGAGLNAQSQTPVFMIGQGDYQEWEVAFWPDTSSTATVQPVVPALRLYPNPAGDWLNMELEPTFAKPELFGRENFRLRVFDWTGRVFSIGQIDPSEPLDVSTLPAGPYLLILDYKNGRFAGPFIKG